MMLPPWIWACGSALLLLLFLLLNHRNQPRYGTLLAGINPRIKTVRWLAAPLRWLERVQPVLDTHPALSPVRQALMQIHGPARSHTMYRVLLAELALYLYTGLCGTLLLPALTDGSVTNLVGGMLVAFVLPLAKVKDTLNRAERKKQDLQLELPELIGKLTLLVQAGETVPKALAICTDRKREEWSHPLYAELARMQQDVHNGYSFAQAMEQFTKRCSLPEVSMFVTTVLINQRRGGDTFVLAMQDVGRQLWEKRKAVARRRGEEASAKLVFPMMLMFLVILGIVGAPALLMMK
ncbi:MAG: type II secretion system F family protein [Paenibacillus dendritiformis]|uniref:type II secretion system F family protein n=1 Tax=uncultured Paenibacillus sp. TaxID=227322 RepID=UPI0025F1AF87|nr:type II secretion system F family protein [uncultured Paenibacillus sp.]MDU5142011.1 type II secretion system F family protein [Paenibacillus dendritiformis]